MKNSFYIAGGDLRSVYEERLPLYRRYADITVYPAGHGIEWSVEEIIKKLSEGASQ